MEQRPGLRIVDLDAEVSPTPDVEVGIDARLDRLETLLTHIGEVVADVSENLIFVNDVLSGMAAYFKPLRKAVADADNRRTR